MKRYGDVVAVNGLDLEVKLGECFGLLGPNGAGKITTIEILEGLMAHDAGDVEVLGLRWGDSDRPLRQRLGIQLQETQLHDKLTVVETLRLFRSAIGLLVASRARTIEALSGMLNLLMLPMWIVSGVFFASLQLPVVDTTLRAGPAADRPERRPPGRDARRRGPGGRGRGRPHCSGCGGLGSFAVALRIFQWR